MAASRYNRTLCRVGTGDIGHLLISEKRTHREQYKVHDAFFFCKSDYKPGYVESNHLSSLYVTIKLKRPT